MSVGNSSNDDDDNEEDDDKKKDSDDDLERINDESEGKDHQFDGILEQKSTAGIII